MRISAEGPQRTCVGCRQRRPQAHLIRCVYGETPVLSRTAPGRGAWLCGIECAQQVQVGALQRAWRRPVSEQDVQLLRSLLESV